MGLVNIYLYFIHEKGVHINYNPTQLKMTVFFYIHVKNEIHLA